MAASNIGDTYPSKYGIDLLDETKDKGIIFIKCEKALNEDSEEIFVVASKKIYFGDSSLYTITHIEEADSTIIYFDSKEVLMVSDGEQCTLSGTQFSASEIAVNFNELITA